jgi:mannose-1-phosphate guanylyltransferase / mannose-6-phosphate isomerase
MLNQLELTPVILCGGVGSRLWPVSRDLHPKPFMRLTDGQSLLQKAFIRAAVLPNVKQVLTVTNRDLFFRIENEYAAVNTTNTATSFILEPFGRNTSAAIATAALHVEQAHGPQSMMLVLAADHLISDQAAFAQAVGKASELARLGKLVTFGIQPNVPETGFGYIEAQGNQVLRFVEKPSLDKAKEYLASGRFLWNSGMFCFTASSMLDAMRSYCPDILEAARACMTKSRVARAKSFAEITLEPDSFSKIPDNSIDYSVMEKASQVAVVPCSIGWSDIGSWSAVGDLSPADSNGNRIDGCATLHAVKDCYIQSNARVVGVVGVSNLIIVDTADALLVVDKSRAQEVKHLYAELKSKNHSAHRHHQTVHRPWGSYTVLEDAPFYKIKRIDVNPGGCLSLQMHHHRSEHWVVVSGIAKVTNGDKQFLIKADESTYIPVGQKHRLENAGEDALILIEVQAGSYLGEDDIVRFEDHYGRV